MNIFNKKLMYRPNDVLRALASISIKKIDLIKPSEREYNMSVLIHKAEKHVFQNANAFTSLGA